MDRMRGEKAMIRFRPEERKGSARPAARFAGSKLCSLRYARAKDAKWGVFERLRITRRTPPR